MIALGLAAIPSEWPKAGRLGMVGSADPQALHLALCLGTGRLLPGAGVSPGEGGGGAAGAGAVGRLGQEGPGLTGKPVVWDMRDGGEVSVRAPKVFSSFFPPTSPPPPLCQPFAYSLYLRVCFVLFVHSCCLSPTCE